MTALPDLDLLLACLDLNLRGVGPTQRQDGPLVTVVLPVHNREWLIEEALESLERQSWRHFEVVVVDDGSTDATPEILGRWAKAHPWLRLFRHETRKGQCTARNLALRESRGEVLTFLDSDNLLYPHALQVIAEAFHADKEAWWIYTAQIWFQPGTVSFRCPPVSLTGMMRPAGSMDLNVISIRRGLYEALGGFDESLSRFVDWDFALRLANAVLPRRIPVPTNHYRHGDWPRVTNTTPSGVNAQAIYKRHLPTPAIALRILYVLNDTTPTPEAEIAVLRSRNLRIHTHHASAGSISEAIAAFRADIIHVIGAETLEVRAQALTHHSQPITLQLCAPLAPPEAAALAARSPGLLMAFAPNASGDQDFAPATPLRAGGGGVDLSLYPPAREKDRSYVVASAHNADDVSRIMAIAEKAPDFRFAIEAPAGLTPTSDPTDGRVCLHIGALEKDRAARIAQATIYVAQDANLLADAIVQAMASGCQVLALRRSPAATMLPYARGFATETEAANWLQSTAHWTTGHAAAIMQRGAEYAHSKRSPTMAVKPLEEGWLQLAQGKWLQSREARHLPRVRVGETLHFSEGALGAQALRVGFHNPELWGVWSGAERATLAFEAEGENWRQLRSLRVRARIFLASERETAPLAIAVNGFDLCGIALQRGLIEHESPVGELKIEPGSPVMVEFRAPPPRSPSDSGSGDRRLFSFALASMTFVGEA